MTIADSFIGRSNSRKSIVAGAVGLAFFASLGMGFWNYWKVEENQAFEETPVHVRQPQRNYTGDLGVRVSSSYFENVSLGDVLSHEVLQNFNWKGDYSQVDCRAVRLITRKGRFFSSFEVYVDSFGTSDVDLVFTGTDTLSNGKGNYSLVLVTGEGVDRYVASRVSPSGSVLPQKEIGGHSPFSDPQSGASFELQRFNERLIRD